MANVVESRSQFRADVPGITRLGKPEEVFSGRQGVRPGVTRHELHVVGEALGGTHQQAIVMGGAGVFVSPDAREAIVRYGCYRLAGSSRRLVLEVEEARVCRISCDYRSVPVPFTEQAKAKLSDILDFPRQRLSEFMLDSTVDAADFGIVQVVCNGANPAAVRRAGWPYQRCGGREVRKCRRYQRPGGARRRKNYRAQVVAVKVQRIQDHVVEGKDRALGERGFEQSFRPPRGVGEAQSRLEVVLV